MKINAKLFKKVESQLPKRKFLYLVSNLIVQQRSTTFLADGQRRRFHPQRRYLNYKIQTMRISLFIVH